MFDLSRKEHQKARASNPVKYFKEIADNPGMDELIEQTTLVEIHNALRETFGDWGRNVNPNGDDKKLYAFEAMRIIQEISRTWACLHNIAASSRDEELCAPADLCAQLAQLENIHDGQRTILQGEFLHMRGKNMLLQDKIANRGLFIVVLEQKLAVLSVHLTKFFDKAITKEPNAGVSNLADPVGVYEEDKRTMLLKIILFFWRPHQGAHFYEFVPSLGTTVQ